MAQNLVYQPHKSSLGMDANIVMLIAYLGSGLLGMIPYVGYIAFVVPIVIYFIEKSSPYVVFHAAQAIVLEIFSCVISIVFAILSAIMTGCAYSDTTGYATLGLLGVISVLGIISTIISIVILVFEIICLVKSWKYECYKLPVFGNFAEKIAAKKPL